jgi:hypothetical protein
MPKIWTAFDGSFICHSQCGCHCSETIVIGTTLAKIQGILLSHPQALTAQIQAVPGLELEATFDIALVGCQVIYSCLDIEVQRLKAHASEAEEPG